MRVALLTGGSDKPYVLGLVEALCARGLSLDVIASDELACEELLGNPQVRFLNFRGSTAGDASRVTKVVRIIRYYLRLVGYAASSQSRVFHILWANRFPLLDHVLVNVIYKLCGRQLVLTAHNVNERKRNGDDSAWNRLTLRLLYRLVDHVLVHTQAMQLELCEDFAVPPHKTSVIPFGINNTLPNTALDGSAARQRLELRADEQVLLFFGRIAPYKGLDLAVQAVHRLADQGKAVRLLVAGRIEHGCETHWQAIEQAIRCDDALKANVTANIGFIPDEDVELYFKAADAVVMPYRAIYQSGVVFLAYSFGLPVIASDVGTFGEDIVEGRTGFTCRSNDTDQLANVIEKYFASELYAHRAATREDIVAYANRRHSWDESARITCAVYADLSGDAGAGAPA